MHKLLFFIILIPFGLFGKVTATIEKPVVVRGSSTTLLVQIDGKDVETPNISKLGKSRVSGISKENFFRSINGITSQGIKVRYNFSPDENMTIPPLRFVADGVEFFTKPIDVVVIEPSRNSEDPFQLQIVVDKKKLFVGQTFKLDVIYREDLSQDVVERRYEEPQGNWIWNKGDTPIAEERRGRYNYLKVSYLYTPQQSGKIEISSAKMRVGTRAKKRDAWGFLFENVNWHEIISNRLSLDVLPAPQKIVGDFEISTKVDKDVLNRGEAVNFEIKIEGNGNIEDIEPFTFNIQNGVVYDEKPEITHKIVNGEYVGTFTQKFAIILDENGVIPSFDITYFDPNIEKIITKKSDKILVQILQNVSNLPKIDDEVKIERKSDTTKEENSNFQFQNFKLETPVLIASFLSGTIFAILVYFIPFRKIFKNLNFLSKREKLKKLLPTIHKSSDDYKQAIKLEKKIY
ncbi:hypothetical protein ThvES_00001290 [Thiovulum sp. ES]|nr:hypothetical protein ThvES_00001290 [Thiovulum sp. ES]